MIKIGFLSKKDKLELLEGLLVMRPRISPLQRIQALSCIAFFPRFTGAKRLCCGYEALFRFLNLIQNPNLTLRFTWVAKPTIGSVIHIHVRLT